MTCNKTYNGWASYETWLVNLWLDNDGIGEEIRRMIRSDECAYGVGQTIKGMVQEMYDMPTSGLVADLVTAALGNVDWTEIARHYLDEMTDEED